MVVMKERNEDECFDMVVEKEKLRLYHDFLVRKKVQEKREKWRQKVNTSCDRHLHLYEEGKQKLLQLRYEEKLEEAETHKELPIIDVSSDHVCNRLYEEGLKKVVAIREREETRSKSVAPKPLPRLYAIDDNHHVCHRLYDESRRLQKIGREKRSLIQSQVRPSRPNQLENTDLISNMNRAPPLTTVVFSSKLHHHHSLSKSTDQREEVELATCNLNTQILKNLKNMNKFQAKREGRDLNVNQESRDDNIQQKDLTSSRD